MAELADAPDSKSGGRKAVWVRPPLRAPKSLKITGFPLLAVVASEAKNLLHDDIRLIQPGSGIASAPLRAENLQFLEGEPGAQLNFASRGHRHGDRSKLRGVHETVRRAQVHFVQRVKCLRPELEIGSLSDPKRSR
jgi:hypothetical protein